LALINRIRTITQIPLMIVDDGSIDGLQDKSIPGAIYLRHKTNHGKGAALKTGLNEARALAYTHAITLDADGQHDPKLIPTFLQRISDSHSALIIGERDLIGNAMPLHRRLSNNITSLILSLRTGRHIVDSQVGYRAYPLNDSSLWNSREDGFQFESDVFIRAGKLNMALVWQPIPVIYSKEGSHMHLLKDTLRFVRTILRSFMC